MGYHSIVIYGMSKSLLKMRFSVKDRGLNETLGKIEADFLRYLTHKFELT